MKSVPSTEERVWAVLAHLSALAFGMGILLPVIAWSEQRRKSNYAAFQSLQALGYQSLGYTFWILGSLVIIIIQSVFTVRELASAIQSGEDPASFMGPVMSLHFVVMILLIGVYLLPPVIAAVATAMGRDFRYPFMGDRLARYLGYEASKTDDESNWLIEDHEDRWVAAMGHFAVIIAIWGMLAPLAAWILQGKRGLFLRFQSIQTLAFQVFVTLLFFSSGFVYLFGFIAFAVTIGFSAGGEFNSSTAIIGFIILGASLLLTIAIILVIPLFHIQGQWAGYRVLKGDNYCYPVVGQWVEKRVMKEKS
ncbi:MAG TPA: DUF4870 domain-containing protein [Anaerolineales bacterium]|nr:DUF4870 domain-containing protein [Anaerolineales bacterium]